MKAMERLEKDRKDLVLAAEAVAPVVAASEKIAKTQLNHLIAVCGEASCAEEIKNYLRYQAARGKWDRGAAKQVIDKMDGILSAKKIEEDLHVAAWRLYAVFLTRAFTYLREEPKASNATSTRPAPVNNKNALPNQGRRS